MVADRDECLVRRHGMGRELVAPVLANMLLTGHLVREPSGHVPPDPRSSAAGGPIPARLPADDAWSLPVSGWEGGARPRALTVGPFHHDPADHCGHEGRHSLTTARH
ncbi:hypothetical protein GCM10010434_050170 [Winogradskya humida]